MSEEYEMIGMQAEELRYWLTGARTAEGEERNELINVGDVYLRYMESHNPGGEFNDLVNGLKNFVGGLGDG